MFGLGDKKREDSGGDGAALFDLEMDLKSVKKRREVILKIQDRIAQIKGFLRAGSSQEEYNQWGFLLQGYVALLQVVSRFGAKG